MIGPAVMFFFELIYMIFYGGDDRSFNGMFMAGGICAILGIARAGYELGLGARIWIAEQLRELNNDNPYQSPTTM